MVRERHIGVRDASAEGFGAGARRAWALGKALVCRAGRARRAPGFGTGRAEARRSYGRAEARRSCGFTLLEVMIAMAILAVALVAIGGINSGALNMHAYAKRLTVATMLARAKMADIEQELQSEGLPADDDTEEGTFEDEGFGQYRWRAEIIRPKTEDIDVSRLLSSLGMDGAGAGSPLSALTGGAGPSGASAAPGGPQMSGLGGMLGGVMQQQMQTMLTQLGQTMREVRLTVSWGEGKQTDEFTVVTHVVSLGAGTDAATSDTTPGTNGAVPGGVMPPPTGSGSGSGTGAGGVQRGGPVSPYMPPGGNRGNR